MTNYSRIVKMFNVNCPSMNCPVKPSEICPLFDPQPCPHSYSKHIKLFFTPLCSVRLNAQSNGIRPFLISNPHFIGQKK